MGTVIALLLAHTAQAQEAQTEADRLIRHGVELRKAHDDEGAAREFQRAYSLAPTARATAQLGLAEQALGRWEEAERHVVTALQASSDPWIAKNRSTLENALGTIQSHIGRVEVLGDPEGAEVVVNGRVAGKLPLGGPVRVSAGEVDVEVRAAGFVSTQRTVTIIGGQYQRLVLHLAKVSVSDPSSPTVGLVKPPPGIGPTEPTTATVDSPPPPAAGPSSLRTTLEWSAAGAAGLGAIVGVTATVLHQKGVSSFDAHLPTCGDDNGTARHTDGSLAPECQGDLNRYRSARTWAIVGFAGAGAFAVTWLVLQLTEPASSAASVQARTSRMTLCGPSLNGFGVSCAARF